MDQHAALDAATSRFATTLARVRPEQWTAQTPNPGWSVRDLVNHVVGGNRRYVLLLTGAPTAEVEALRDLDHLSDDPHADFLTTSTEVAAAFQAPGALERTVHHRLGDRSGADLLIMRIGEHALHGWDLARAIDVDDSLDPAVVDVMLAAIDADPSWLGRAGYVPREGANRLGGAARLLALTGRG